MTTVDNIWINTASWRKAINNFTTTLYNHFMPCKLYFLTCKTSLTYMQTVLTTFNTHSHTKHFIDIYYKKLSFHTNFKLFRLKVLFYVLNIVYIREHIAPLYFRPFRSCSQWAYLRLSNNLQIAVLIRKKF